MGIENASKQQLDNLFQSFLALSTPILPGETNFPLGFESASSTDDWTLSRDTSSDSESRSSPKRKAGDEVSLDCQKRPKSAERQERRRMQNRQAAATSRIKKKNYHKELEAKVDYLTEANMKLQLQVAALMEQNLRLQDGSSSQLTSQPHSELVTLESAVGGNKFSLGPTNEPEIECPPSWNFLMCDRLGWLESRSDTAKVPQSCLGETDGAPPVFPDATSTPGQNDHFGYFTYRRDPSNTSDELIDTFCQPLALPPPLTCSFEDPRFSFLEGRRTLSEALEDPFSADDDVFGFSFAP